jgi:intracellular multiplication protein IcmB
MRTQIMYLVATHILARDFLLKEDHLANIPPRYKAYNGARIRQFSTRMKALSLDEKHVTAHCPQIEDQIDLLARTGRKDTFQLNLASQLLADFPARIAGLATEIFLTGLNQGETAREAAERFSLSAGSLDHIENGRLSGPHRLNDLSAVYAAPFLAVWRLDDMEAGGRQAEQLLYNVIGPREMWALSTRPDDVHLRDQLCRVLSSQEETWRRLSLVFPNGTAREAIEKRTAELAARGRNKGDARQAVIGGLIQDICDGTGIALGVGRAEDRDINPRLAREQREVMQALVDDPA